MGDYFKPWRRKFGVLSLGVACLITAVWVTCLFNHANINRLIFNTLPGNDGCISLFTDGASISLVRCEQFNPTQEQIGGISESTDLEQTEENEKLRMHDGDQTADDAVQETISVPITLVHINLVPIVEIPFWLIVFPLTLISAWLLLAKPSVAKPTAISQK